MPHTHSESDLLEAVGRVGRALSTTGHRYAFIGGLAVSVWARPRATVDIDVMLAVTSIVVEPIIAALSAEGFTVEPGAVHTDILMAGFTAQRLYPSGQRIPVDVLVSANPIVDEILGRATVRRLANLDIIVPAAEDLIVLKLQANRPQDIADADAILRARGAHLDLHYLHEQADIFDVREILDCLLTRPE